MPLAAIPNVARRPGVRADKVKFTPERKAEIVTYIAMRSATYDLPLSMICREPGMPAVSTFREWVLADDKLAAIWSRARGDQGHAIYDRIQVIERRLLAPPLIQGRAGEPVRNPYHLDPNVARVAIWSMQWRAARMLPGMYAERRIEEHTGSVEVKPIDFAPDFLRRTVIDVAAEDAVVEPTEPAGQEHQTRSDKTGHEHQS